MLQPAFGAGVPKLLLLLHCGGIAYLADFSGDSIDMSYGAKSNAVFTIYIYAMIIAVTGVPLAYYAAR